MPLSFLPMAKQDEFRPHYMSSLSLIADIYLLWVVTVLYTETLRRVPDKNIKQEPKEHSVQRKLEDLKNITRSGIQWFNSKNCW